MLKPDHQQVLRDARARSLPRTARSRPPPSRRSPSWFFPKTHLQLSKNRRLRYHCEIPGPKQLCKEDGTRTGFRLSVTTSAQALGPRYSGKSIHPNESKGQYCISQLCSIRSTSSKFNHTQQNIKYFFYHQDLIHIRSCDSTFNHVMTFGCGMGNQGHLHNSCCCLIFGNVPFSLFVGLSSKLLQEKLHSG